MDRCDRVVQFSNNPDKFELAPELNNHTIQGLMEISPEDKARLCASILDTGTIRDALKVYTGDNGKYQILCGYNLWEIAKEYPGITIPYEVYDEIKKKRDRLYFAISDNVDRRHLDSECKTKLIKFYLKDDPGQSARAVGKKVGVDHKTAQKIKDAMIRRGEIPHVGTVIDSKGRQQPAKKKKNEKPFGPKMPKGQPAPLFFIDRRYLEWIAKYVQMFPQKEDRERVKRFIVNFIEKL